MVRSGKQDAIYVDDLYDENVALRVEVERLRAAGRELLKGGTHEGECTNVGFERDDSCELHVEASKKREQKAREVLGGEQEIERLSGFVAEMQPELGRLKTEIERLERLLTDADWRELDEKRKVEALAKHNGSLMMDAVEREKEIERLKADLHFQCRGMLADRDEQIEDLQAEIKRLRDLLQRIAEWDHMDSAADGPFWRSEIDKALGRDQE